jgi:hypothetical protein
MTTMRSTRTEIRFPLEASVEFWWKDMGGATHHGLGRSRDISEHGVFAWAERCPHGDQVELNIVIDELTESGELLQFQINGKVLRVDQILAEKEGFGFAVLSDQPFSDTGSKRLN